MAVRFTVPGWDETFELVERTTFGEAKAVEKITGLQFADIEADDRLSKRTDVIQAMIWVSMKRKVPTLTLSELDDVPIDGIDWERDEEPEVGADPTEAGGEPDGPA